MSSPARHHRYTYREYLALDRHANAYAGTRLATQASPDKKPASNAGAAPRTANPAISGSELLAPRGSASDLPKKLDRSMIRRGVDVVRSGIVACGVGFEGVQVRLSVTVAPDGTVSNVVVKDSPDAWLSSCLSTRMRAARFTPTQSGGAFSQPFSF